jgi:ribosome-binding protein aMBF1 (putative translation factor)
MKKAITLNDYIGKKIKNSDFKSNYDREALINAIAKMVVELRHSTRLTQLQLAKKAGTTQAVIARLESGVDERIPSVDLLARIADASHVKLNISFAQQ